MSLPNLPKLLRDAANDSVAFDPLTRGARRGWDGTKLTIRTNEGFAYLAVVIDLYLRRVIGWSMQSRQTTEVVLRALLMAVWR